MPLFRPTICEINTNALRHNYRQLKKSAGLREILGIVKANAYGHGATTVARVLASEGMNVFGVASVEEGIELRRSGILGEILCLGGSLGATAQDLLEYALSPVLFNEEGVKLLTQQLRDPAKPLGIHLKVDTGMGRLGEHLENLPSLLKLISESPGLRLKSVMTHLARADEDAKEATEEQIKLFEQVEKEIKKSGISCKIFHLCNSAALLEQTFNVSQWVRPGIALYGAYPHPRFESKVSLRPVMSWKSQIVSLKDFRTGSPISYGATFVTQRPSRIAVVAVGYADGYFRAFSNRGIMLVHGRRVPVVGRVCMDLTMIDVTDVPLVHLGDEVVLLGSQHEESIRAEELASLIHTISYEIFCAVSARVPRIVVSGGENPS